MDVLAQHGWPKEAIAFFDGMEMEEIKSNLGHLASEWDLEQFGEIRREAKRQKLLQDLEDKKFARDPVSYQKNAGWADRFGWRDLTEGSKGVSLKMARTLLPRAIWPTRFARRTAVDLDDQQRAKIEEEERERLTRELVSLLRKAKLIEKEKGEDEGGRAQFWATRRHAMGRRPNTLRVHVRLGRKLVAYMLGAYGRPWFRDESDVMEYVGMRLEEPCGKSVPRSVWGTIRFLEQAAELGEQHRISSSPALRNFFDEVSRHPIWTENARQRTSANCLVVRIILGWEEMVMSPDEKKYIRVFAWFKLIKLWGALRWDDTMGIPPASLEMLKNKGLKGKIVRSKTSGEGRRVEVQEFYVSLDGWLERRDWLREGWSLFLELGASYGNGNRDFLLPRPGRHLESFRGAMVKYPEAMAMSRALLGMVKRPDRDGDWRQLLISIPETTAYWSEHSERVTIISWAAALGVDPDSRKRWGRWRPTTDEDYAKTSQTMVMAAQLHVAEKLREGLNSPSLVEDEEVLLGLGKWLEERGLIEHQIDDQLMRLRLKPGRKWKRENARASPTSRASEVGSWKSPLAWGDDAEAGSPEIAPTTPGEIELASGGDSLVLAAQAPSPTEAAEEVLDFAEQMMVSDGMEQQVSDGTFVLSVVGRSKRRTLHQVGACYRRPGIHFKEYLIVGDVRPVLEKGERLCISCFGKRDQIASEVGVGARSDSDSGSSLSSSTSLGSTSSDDS